MAYSCAKRHAVRKEGRRRDVEGKEGRMLFNVSVSSLHMVFGSSSSSKEGKVGE